MADTEAVMTYGDARKIAAGTARELRAQAHTSREAYWLNGAADVIEALTRTPPILSASSR